MNVKSDKKKSVFWYDNHMPETDDLTLIVLKGHLLVEELLPHWAFPNAQYLPPKFSFNNLTDVLRATVPQGCDDASWNLILKLNDLRNDLAHKLESGERRVTLKQLFEIHRQINPTAGMEFYKIEEGALSQAQRVRLVVQDSMKFLLSLISEYQNNAPKPKAKTKKIKIR